jgi:hypothetical protein
LAPDSLFSPYLGRSLSGKLHLESRCLPTPFLSNPGILLDFLAAIRHIVATCE